MQNGWHADELPARIHHGNHQLQSRALFAPWFSGGTDHSTLGRHERRSCPVEPKNGLIQPSGKVFLACGLWLIALGLYFLFLRPALLPEDSAFMGSSLEAIRSAVPGLERWLGHVFNVMGGFMIAVGVLTMFLSWRFLSSREPGTFASLSVAGATGVALMSATNFLLHSNFRWLLLLPALLWLAGLLCYLRESATSARRVHMEGEV